MDFTTAFQALTTTEKMVKTVDSVIKNTKGHKRALLRELKENLNLLLLVRNKHFSAGKVIPKLHTKNYLAASDAGFNFKLIKRSPLREETTRGVPQFKRYLNWSTERLFENIYLKTNQLQSVIELGTDPPNFDLNSRVENLTRLMILLLNHIYS
jgi:hypothetical protein